MTYFNQNTGLSADFIPLDEQGNQIQRMYFLKALTQRQYIPIREEKNGKVYYKLYRLDKEKSTINDQILTTVAQFAEIEENFMSYEGKPFPTFKVLDLKGNQYDNQNTQGKILVLKTWFIRCHACVEEMPAMNKMVKAFDHRKDIVFLSLALDNEKKLKEFLSKKSFNYATVANQENFIENTLGFNSFPTHIIVSKSGRILKVFSDGERYLPYYLAKYLK
ncbi:TlpA family protein disulfide reductase [Flectobacillus rivi]|uniref:TlpA disulfide reductase family protein n=1 Tax=Flectobacillus rivi TaxID=2984209 RepID=A0ABT6Z1B5_9BACT|nr:TlpA disulfide reductase family protein [Flectobacillus rivi]MDI9874923.1 TlpA disulfide reductase family protein [Flectobacillus rivi]